MTKEQFIESFKTILNSNGDMFFDSGSVEQDYDHIVDTINMQGYWSGNRVRYHFDEDLNLVEITDRKFG